MRTGISEYRMTTKLKAIGFDWSGVVFFHSINFRRDGAAYLNISEQEFSTSYFKYNHLSNLKDLSSLEFWTTVFTDLQRGDDAAGFVDFLNTAPAGKLNTHIIEVVQLLNRKGYKVGLLSNNTSSGAAEARAAGVDDIFDVALFSAEVGLMKPDPRAFQLLADKLGVALCEMVFVDDSPKCFEQVNDAGYTPILYKNMPEFLEKLVALDILTKDEANILF